MAGDINSLNLLVNLYIEDIYFFDVNTKYISSRVLKTSDFSRVRSTSEKSDVFNSQDLPKKKNLFLLYFSWATCNVSLKKKVLKMQERKNLSKLKYFWYQNIVTF